MSDSRSQTNEELSKKINLYYGLISAYLQSSDQKFLEKIKNNLIQQNTNTEVNSILNAVLNLFISKGKLDAVVLIANDFHQCDLDLALQYATECEQFSIIEFLNQRIKDLVEETNAFKKKYDMFILFIDNLLMETSPEYNHRLKEMDDYAKEYFTEKDLQWLLLYFVSYKKFARAHVLIEHFHVSMIDTWKKTLVEPDPQIMIFLKKEIHLLAIKAVAKHQFDFFNQYEDIISALPPEEIEDTIEEIIKNILAKDDVEALEKVLQIADKLHFYKKETIDRLVDQAKKASEQLYKIFIESAVYKTMIAKQAEKESESLKFNPNNNNQSANDGKTTEYREINKACKDLFARGLSLVDEFCYLATEASKAAANSKDNPVVSKNEISSGKPAYSMHWVTTYTRLIEEYVLKETDSDRKKQIIEELKSYEKSSDIGGTIQYVFKSFVDQRNEEASIFLMMKFKVDVNEINEKANQIGDNATIDFIIGLELEILLRGSEKLEERMEGIKISVESHTSKSAVYKSITPQKHEQEYDRSKKNIDTFYDMFVEYFAAPTPEKLQKIEFELNPENQITVDFLDGQSVDDGMRQIIQKFFRNGNDEYVKFLIERYGKGNGYDFDLIFEIVLKNLDEFTLHRFLQIFDKTDMRYKDRVITMLALKAKVNNKQLFQKFQNHPIYKKYLTIAETNAKQQSAPKSEKTKKSKKIKTKASTVPQIPYVESTKSKPKPLEEQDIRNVLDSLFEKGRYEFKNSATGWEIQIFGTPETLRNYNQKFKLAKKNIPLTTTDNNNQTICLIKVKNLQQAAEIFNSSSIRNTINEIEENTKAEFIANQRLPRLLSDEQKRVWEEQLSHIFNNVQLEWKTNSDTQHAYCEVGFPKGYKIRGQEKEISVEEWDKQIKSRLSKALGEFAKVEFDKVTKSITITPCDDTPPNLSHLNEDVYSALFPQESTVTSEPSKEDDDKKEPKKQDEQNKNDKDNNNDKEKEKEKEMEKMQREKDVVEARSFLSASLGSSYVISTDFRFVKPVIHEELQQKKREKNESGSVQTIQSRKKPLVLEYIYSGSSNLSLEIVNDSDNDNNNNNVPINVLVDSKEFFKELKTTLDEICPDWMKVDYREGTVYVIFNLEKMSFADMQKKLKEKGGCIPPAAIETPTTVSNHRQVVMTKMTIISLRQALTRLKNEKKENKSCLHDNLLKHLEALRTIAAEKDKNDDPRLGVRYMFHSLQVMRILRHLHNRPSFICYQLRNLIRHLYPRIANIADDNCWKNFAKVHQPFFDYLYDEMNNQASVRRVSVFPSDPNKTINVILYGMLEYLALYREDLNMEQRTYKSEFKEKVKELLEETPYPESEDEQITVIMLRSLLHDSRKKSMNNQIYQIIGHDSVSDEPVSEMITRAMSLCPRTEQSRNNSTPVRAFSNS